MPSETLPKPPHHSFYPSVGGTHLGHKPTPLGEGGGWVQGLGVVIRVWHTLTCLTYPTVPSETLPKPPHHSFYPSVGGTHLGHKPTPLGEGGGWVQGLGVVIRVWGTLTCLTYPTMPSETLPKPPHHSFYPSVGGTHLGHKSTPPWGGWGLGVGLGGCHQGMAHPHIPITDMYIALCTTR